MSADSELVETALTPAHKGHKAQWLLDNPHKFDFAALTSFVVYIFDGLQCPVVAPVKTLVCFTFNSFPA